MRVACFQSDLIKVTAPFGLGCSCCMLVCGARAGTDMPPRPQAAAARASAVLRDED